ncbi:unnamed protein product [Rotaria sp. Silwood2]|nr:unnamed protein product [Rotaria sp. Silwood2]CAF3190930.1 unnamed protein product [Rotaria sp. Silwood2]CAF4153166.1 unnamed protein product [Rotaria sp. Silwood2]CAF4389419.1 unnamed protein product [Rotaria sp. Silwood2]
MIIGFDPDNAVDIRDITVVERELQKFLPNCKVKHVFGHDWSCSYRGCTDGAFESGFITSVRKLQQYFNSQII